MSTIAYAAALEKQLEQIRFWSSLESQRRAAEFLAAGGRSLFPTAASSHTAVGVQAAILHSLEHATPYAIDATVAPVIRAMDEALPSAALTAADLLTSTGWLWLGQDIALPGRYGPDGQPAPLVAYSWLVPPNQATGILLSAYVALPDRAVPSLEAMFWWPFGMAWDAVGEDTDPRVIAVRRYFAAVLAFCQQRIATVTHRDPDRALRRRVARDAPELPATVRVIQLRLREAGDDAPAGPMIGLIDWRVQWIVRGHWRRQWYPSEQATKLVWIAPFVKGPPGKPLKQPAIDVFVLDR